MENVHVIAEISVKDKLKVVDPEKAEKFKCLSEWDIYEDIETKSSLIKVIEDKDSLNLKTVNHLTYDNVNKKFVGITLEQPVRNIVVYDDLSEIMPTSTIQDIPNIDEVKNLKDSLKVTFELLLWTNQLRFQMPWRWS